MVIINCPRFESHFMNGELCEQNIHSLMRTHSFAVISSNATSLTFGFSKLLFIMIGFFSGQRCFLYLSQVSKYVEKGAGLI